MPAYSEVEPEHETIFLKKTKVGGVKEPLHVPEKAFVAAERPKCGGGGRQRRQGWWLRDMW